MKIKHASFFTGIGGFDLAAQWCNWENVLQCEIDDFCQLVLERNFPNVNRYSDIKQFDGKPLCGTIDIISGGFPCQPYSVAGKRRGAEDDRALWPEMLRVITEIKPTWFVGENVAGIVNMELDTVLSDLERIGYTCQAFVIPACAVNAPHKRDRVWIIANAKGSNDRRNICDQTSRQKPKFGNSIEPSTATNSDSPRWQEQHFSSKSEKQRYCAGLDFVKQIAPNANSFRLWRKIDRKRKPGFVNKTFARNYWSNWPTQSPVRTGDDGIPTKLVRSAIKAAGNAIVPQVAYEIFKAINKIVLNLKSE